MDSFNLDILGSQPSLYKLYTQICSIYAVPDPSQLVSVIKTLDHGLGELAKTFPWLAGTVINEGASEGITGTFRILPATGIPLVIKDLRNHPTAPSIDSLRKARFPSTMLDEDMIAPCRTINPSGSCFGLVNETGPVFAVQVNYISGGIILTFAGQHNVMDMTGQANVIEWLSKMCCGIPLSSEVISVGMANKREAVPLLEDSWTPGPELDWQMASYINKSANEVSSRLPNLSPSSWRYFEFSAASAQFLKAHAMDTKTDDCTFISTDDALCAFIWKCVSQSRVQRLRSTDSSTFARALDARRCLNIDPAYPGALTNMAYSRLSIQELLQLPLGAIASRLRRQLDPSVRNLAFDTRALATYLDRAKDKSEISITAAVDVSTGMALSSWAKVGMYDLDFNLGLGKPEIVRRPRFMPVESLAYIMPKAPNGEFAIALCLRDDDWEQLNILEDWITYTTYIG